MATLRIPDRTLARLRAAAAARKITVEAYLADIAAEDSGTSSTGTSVKFSKNAAGRAAAAESIRKLAVEVKGKSTIEELIADKHSGHRY